MLKILRMEINILKEQIKESQNELSFLHTQDLEIETRLVLIENQPSSSIEQAQNIAISEEHPSDQQFVSTIGHINFQKGIFLLIQKLKVF